MVGKVCDANGQCVDGTGNCGSFACANGICGVCCGSSRDCAAGFVCRNCTCVAPLPVGEACGSTEQCASGHCRDGRCCDRACNGQCEACDLAGLAGTCSAVTGAPRGSRTACTGSAGSACAGSCDGVVRDACIYPAAGKPCGDAECVDDQRVNHACDGAGLCSATPASCGVYACAAGACKTSCVGDSDCSNGYVCRDALCVERAPAPDAGVGGSGGSGGVPDAGVGGSGGSGGVPDAGVGGSRAGGTSALPGGDDDSGCSLSRGGSRASQRRIGVAMVGVLVFGMRRSARRRRSTST
jgi:hypothetical protein